MTLNQKSPNVEILLVDDDQNSYVLTGELFKKFTDDKFILHWTDSFEDALEKMRAGDFQLYLLDYRLAGKTGLDLLREARSSGCQSPVIFLTSQSEKQIIVETLRSGAADYLVKGEFNASLLERSIRYALENARAVQAFHESEIRYRSLIETLPVMFYLIEPKPPFAPIYVSPAFAALGYPLAEWIKKPETWLNAIHADDRERILNELKAAMSSDGQTDFTYRMLTGDGDLRWIHDCGQIIRNEAGQVIHWQGFMIDITNGKLAEIALSENEERYRELFENANDLIYTHDLQGNFTSLNRAGEMITGYTREEALKMNIAEVVAPEHLTQARRMTFDKLHGGAATTYELEILSKKGQRVTLELSTSLIEENGQPFGIQGIARDISERKRDQEQLRHNALYDTLTNLPNRSQFMSELKTAIKTSETEPDFRFAVLFLDLDRFKVINDSLGHLIGDKLLVAIAGRIRQCLRAKDTVARLGGDEFTILIGKINEDQDAVLVAERLLKQLSKPFMLENYEVFTSASIGIVISDGVRRKQEDLLRDADTAMYRAKESGKARYEIFDREMHVRNMNLLQIETDLRRAVEREEFEVFYQPIVSLETGAIAEFEALIRWRHPESGLIAPNDFIGVAEETGLIIPIGKWILQKAMRQTRDWQQRFEMKTPLSISVNLSAKQLIHPNLTAQVKEILEDVKLDPRYLKLEVTESTVMENSEKSLNVLSELDNLGISLSTDDFGTGYSSLSYLHRFPFDRLKIDRSFVNKMDSESKSEVIVRTIMMLGKNLNIDVVAEGIETERQLEQLKNLGCELGQGFLFARPLPAEEAEALIQNGLSEPVGATGKNLIFQNHA